MAQAVHKVVHEGFTDKEAYEFYEDLIINTMREEGAGCFGLPFFGKRMRNGYQNTGNGIAVLIMLGLGYFCKAKNVFDEKGLLGLKAFISNITLPVVLFNAFLCAEYNAKIVVLFVLILCGLSACNRYRTSAE